MTAASTVVTGASRGLGLEFVRQCLERGDRVFAGTRGPAPALAKLSELHGDRLVPLILDVGNEASIEAARNTVAGLTPAVNLLLNCAGIYSRHSRSWNPAATPLATVSSAELVDVFRVNAAGPILMVRHFRDLLEAGRARVLNLSSLMGSVSHKTTGGEYAYAASKAALNIMTRAVAAELALAGVVALAVTPGWVRTEMGGAAASLSPEESVRGMLQVADQLTAADSGRFVDYRGVPQPW